MIKDTDNDTLKTILQASKDQLKKVSETANWRHELYKTGTSREYPSLRTHHLGNFVRYGNYSEDQVDCIIEWLAGNFKGNGYNYIHKVLLPEALVMVTEKILGVSYENADKFLMDAGADEAWENFSEKALKKKSKIIIVYYPKIFMRHFNLQQNEILLSNIGSRI